LTIAVDLDGTLANIYSVVLAEVSAEIGETLTPNLMTYYDWLPDAFGEGMFQRFSEFWTRYSAECVEPIERDVEVLTRRIRSRYGGLDIVTQHTELERKNITEWLQHWNVQYDNLVLCGLQDKSKLPYICYIDDNPFLAEKLRNSAKVLYLYDQPWNRLTPGKWNIRRVHCLREVLD